MVKDLYNFLGEHISNPILLGIFTLIAFLLYLTRKAWSKLVEGMKILPFIVKIVENKRSQKNLYDIDDLIDHLVFDVLEDYSTSTHIFHTDGTQDMSKTYAFQDLLECMMLSSKKHIEKIIVSADDEMSTLKLRRLVSESFQDCNKYLNDTMLKKLEIAGVRKEHREMVMSKFLGLREISLKHYDRVFDSVFKDHSLSSNYQKLSTILLIISMEVPYLVKTCIEAFEDTNGIFRRINYERV